MAQKVAPEQQTMGGGTGKSPASLGINLEETMFMVGENGREEFMFDHIDLGDALMMMCFPCCCLKVPYRSKGRQVRYVQQCGPCACPWGVEVDKQLVGKVKAVGCCDNGCFFCMCSLLTCGGHIKILGVNDGSNTEKFVFAKKLFPFWPWVQACAMACGPFGIICNHMDGCCNYCKGTEFKSLTQPVFKGPWKRGDGEPTKVGDFIMTYRYNPYSLCCAAPTPMKFFFRPNDPNEKFSYADIASLSLILQLYRGLPVPCKQCGGGVDFQQPTGVRCLDVGMMTQTKWTSVTQVMAESHAE